MLSIRSSEIYLVTLEGTILHHFFLDQMDHNLIFPDLSRSSPYVFSVFLHATPVSASCFRVMPPSHAQSLVYMAHELFTKRKRHITFEAAGIRMLAVKMFARLGFVIPIWLITKWDLYMKLCCPDVSFGSQEGLGCSCPGCLQTFGKEAALAVSAVFQEW